MDRHIPPSSPPLCTLAIPELDAFELATFDALPIWEAQIVPPQPPVILVVDDEPHVGQIVRRFLQEMRPQHEIIAITHPAEVLDQIQGRKIALMITDFNMPDHNGVQLSASVKRCSPYTQVLLMTAYSTGFLRHLARHQGVDYYLPKPFQLPDLEALVCAALTAYDNHLTPL